MNNVNEIVNQLHATLGKMETALGVIPDAIVWVDEKGKIEWCNAPFDSLVGRRHIEVLGAGLVDLLPLEKHGQPLSPKEHPVNVVLGNQPVTRENYEFTRNGQEKILQISGNFLRIDKDDQSGVFVVLDVTPLMAEEKEREQNHLGLVRRETIMASLLEDLQASKERLEEQGRTLQEVNRQLQTMGALKDEFVATVSHELRTPLTAIKEGVSLLLDNVLGKINEEQRDFLTTIDQSVDRLADLINNMLDLAKIEAGRIRLQRRKVSLQELIGVTLQSYRPIIGHRVIKTELAPVPPVFADPNRIIQVLGNLLSNAVKFTPDDGVIAFKVEEQEGQVGVSVEDNGIGVAPEDLSKLFQKFSQVGRGENRQRGTGLGLALCKQFVELHRGEISATSELGRGTKFNFTLPIYTDPLALEETFKEQVEMAKRTQQNSVGQIVLDAEPFVKGVPESQTKMREERLDEALKQLRKNLHSTDGVLFIEPHWIVILAVTDAKGVDSITARLQQGVLKQWMPLRLSLGRAIYPSEGTNAQDLFRKATASLLHAGGGQRMNPIGERGR